MDRELEVIHDDMEQTRAKLADKLGALEQQVRETVSSVSETVTSGVEGVKQVVDTVSETVGSVTETFNISKHIEQHPMVSMGVALASGFVLAQMFGGSSRPVVVQQAPPQPAPPPPEPRHQVPAYQPPAHQPAAYQPPPAAPQQHSEPQKSMLSGLSSMLPSSLLPSLESLMPDLRDLGNTVISGLGGLAIGSLMGAVRDLVAQGLPKEWTGEINKFVDEVTTQLGGKPQPARGEQDGKDSKKDDKQGGEQKSQDKPQERGHQGGQRSSRGTRQPAYPG